MICDKIWDYSVYFRFIIESREVLLGVYREIWNNNSFLFNHDNELIKYFLKSSISVWLIPIKKRFNIIWNNVCRW